MQNLMKLLQGFGLAMLFVILGIYLVVTKDALLPKLSGILCIVFFGGFSIWAIYKKSKKINK